MTAITSIFGLGARQTTKPPLVVFWDMDGVLVNSEPLHRKKLVFVAKRYGVTITDEHFNTPQTFNVPDGNGGMKLVTMKLHGAGDKNIYWWMLSQPSTVEKKPNEEQWLGELLAYYKANTHELKPRGWIVTQIRLMQFYCWMYGIQLVHGIVTSGIKEQLEANQKALPSDIKFSFTVNASDLAAGKGKPNPDPYLAGIAKAKELPELQGKNFIGVAVEDSETGVQSARDAGLVCVHWPFGNERINYLPPRKEDAGKGRGYGVTSSWGVWRQIMVHYRTEAAKP